MQDVIDFNLLKEYDTTLKDILGVWTKQKAYSLGDKVKYKGHLLECTTAGTSGTITLNFTNLDIGDTITDGTVVWELVEEESGKGIDFYTVGESYEVGDIVIYSGNIYQCITAHTATSTFDTTKWEEVSKGGIPYYNQGTSYEVDDQVIYDNKIYKCITAHTSTAAFDTTKWAEISAGGSGGIAEYTTGTSYSSGDLVIKDNVLYKANTTTSTTWVDSEWDVIGTTFNTTSAYAQKIVTNVVAPYEMLLQVGDSNYCKPPIDVLKKTGGSDNVTLTLENYNNTSAYTGTSDFLKIENSKAKLYNYKEYPITPQTLSTIDIGVSDEINFDEFVSSSGTPDSNTLALLHFDEDAVTDATGRIWTAGIKPLPTIDTENKVYGIGSAYVSGNEMATASDNDIDLATGDFTIDFWWRQPTSGEVYTNGDSACIYSGKGNGTIYICIINNVLSFFRSYQGKTIEFSTNIRKTDGLFHHFAIVRSSETVYLFVDGVMIESKPDSSTYTESSSTVHIFGMSGSGYTNNIAGNIDEFRISKVARWTSDFTPPTQPYARPNYNISSLEVN